MSEVRQVVGCVGCHAGRSLKVACIFFERIETLTLCTCTSPALQLLQRGLFPCAPLLPSLAVDLNMLEFVNGLFVNAAPNTTAWCETLESFLGNRRYKLSTRNSLHRCFGAAMQWYATLIDKKNHQLANYLDQFRLPATHCSGMMMLFLFGGGDLFTLNLFV
ncbi:uncharacterized protein LACBIDRAFT_310168 [Laccaria bicolor S238N-H82]|uniref:Predicted protein n=1 Tax=Laccaria bicolor (strain S238N-H82 / ATCC MYA-4686) TaxID=486041 RepID=B0DTZ8_LACBS|nr:uncharacterized protein LACBIDRAFT_310168 [Laccaria bicolor S238N-H82]EDR01938.1 predicted protein [Laccaria bicolor S238N-H82]|eukprot:XP_001887329.1 predicted protein [Laccaria bicolor S238N-H82]